MLLQVLLGLNESSSYIVLAVKGAIVQVLAEALLAELIVLHAFLISTQVKNKPAIEVDERIVINQRESLLGCPKWFIIFHPSFTNFTMCCISLEEALEEVVMPVFENCGRN